MKIVIINNFSLVNKKVEFANQLELFYYLKKIFNKKIKQFYILTPKVVFVELDNIEGIKTSIIKNKNIFKEIVAFKFYQKAIQYATEYHKDQKYGGFLPYYFHLKQTDKVIDTFYQDVPSGDFFKIKTAALLHDILEDTSVSLEKLAYDFGDEIADIVLKVTKINENDTEEFEANYYAQMSKNPLAVFVKIADKCANAKQTVKNKSIWHANRLVNGHNLFKKYTYKRIKAIQTKQYLDNLILKLASLL